MKKFYTFLMAAAVVGSATAANHVVNLNVEKQLQKTVVSSKVQNAEVRKAKASKSSITQSASMQKFEGKTVKSIRKADGQATVEGLWVFDMGDYYFQSSINGTLQVEYEATLYGDEVVFEDPTGYEMPFIGVIDASGKSISFSREYIGSAIGYYVYQQPFEYSYTLKDLVDLDALVGNYYAEQGVILFDSDQGLAWEACSDQAGTSMEGYFGIYDFEGATQEAGDEEKEPLDEVQEGLWNTIGNATFVDAWILPSYSMGGIQINPNDYPYEVELQQSTLNENIYRLWKPYTNGNSLLDEVNQSKFEGQIQFDISDPDHVVVIANDMPAGFKNSNGEFYLANELGWYMNYLGGDEYKGLIIDMIYGDDAETEPDTFKDGIVTINTPMFDFSAAHAEGYSWTNNPYQSIITFPEEDTSAVNTIGVENAKVRYINLQGIEVADPSNGIFIKVEGNKTTKVVR